MPEPVPMLVLIPGLGADAGLYSPQRDYFGDRLLVSPWITPLRPDETIDSYGRRLAEVIGTLPGLRRPYFVGGISFGGMVAAEIAEANRDDVAGVFLIGSCTRREQVRLVYRLACRGAPYLPRGLVKGMLNHLVPTATAWLEALDAEDAAVMKDVWFRADTRLMTWAAHAITRWSPGAFPRTATFSAHGQRDQVIPIAGRHLRPGVDLRIFDGRHLIHLTHSDMINRWMDRRMRACLAAL